MRGRLRCAGGSVLVAAPLVAIVDIVHDELYRKRFLPSVTDADLDNLARQALHDAVAQGPMTLTT